MSIAKVLNCESCGAPISRDLKSCEYCGSQIDIVICSKCGTSSLKNSENCVGCGNFIFKSEQIQSDKKCPRCNVSLVNTKWDSITGELCNKCNGVFIFNNSMQDFIKNQYLDSIGNIRKSPKKFSLKPDSSPYLKCPICNEWMARKNYSVQDGPKSGILVDICLDDGIWFDYGEFEQLGEFIRSGGLFKK